MAELKSLLSSKDEEMFSIRKELEEAIYIVNNVEIQFEEEKKNNAERYKEMKKH